VAHDAVEGEERSQGQENTVVEMVHARRRVLRVALAVPDEADEDREGLLSADRGTTEKRRHRPHHEAPADGGRDDGDEEEVAVLAHVVQPVGEMLGPQQGDQVQGDETEHGDHGGPADDREDLVPEATLEEPEEDDQGREHADSNPGQGQEECQGDDDPVEGEVHPWVTGSLTIHTVEVPPRSRGRAL